MEKEDNDNCQALVHEVPDDERKAFVRAYVHRAVDRLRKPRRSKDPIRGKIGETVRDLLVNTDPGRLELVREANFRWQKLQLRKFLDAKRSFTYQDMKDFIHSHGWDTQWIPTRRLQAYWLSITRTGRI
jgi:hypothetical protein